jgi:hypothetical protein
VSQGIYSVFKIDLAILHSAEIAICSVDHRQPSSDGKSTVVSASPSILPRELARKLANCSLSLKGKFLSIGVLLWNTVAG